MTLTGMFLKYMGIFCGGALVLLVVFFLLFTLLTGYGILLPANYAEESLKSNAKEFASAKQITEDMIPPGCSYGVYGEEGMRYGSFSEQEAKNAWQQYEEDSIYGVNGGYYRFFKRENGEICIVRYEIGLRFAAPTLHALLPKPERTGIILFFLLFFAQALVLAKIFAKKMGRRLIALQEATGKIAENDLDFVVEHSDIREIDAVLSSLGRMRDALKKSLAQQWEIQRQKREQLAALAHDIKTPLTVIRGNAELLEENGLDAEGCECCSAIVQSVREMEQYLAAMREMLLYEGEMTNENASIDAETGVRTSLMLQRGEIAGITSCACLREAMKEQAVRLTAARRMAVEVQERELRMDAPPWEESEGSSDGKMTENDKPLLRAWNNLVENALDYTDQERGIVISFAIEVRKEKYFFLAGVEDYGRGFTGRDLVCGTQEFYRGDNSRHGREHQGLGLAIAKGIVESYGGTLELSNSGDTKGARAVLRVPLKK